MGAMQQINIDPANDSALTIQVLHDLDSFLQIKNDWDELYEIAIKCFPTVSHSWLTEWWRAFATTKSTMYVILVWKQNRLVGAAPLYYQKKKLLGRDRQYLMLMANDWVD